MSDYQVMPELTAEEYAELKADIAERGVMIPIEFDEEGNVLDGYHRLKICSELGIEDYPMVVRIGLTEAEKLTHARKLNIARRHLTQEQKRVLIRDQLKATPEQSDRQIASALGVDHKTVSSQRKESEAGGEIPQLDKAEGADGKTYPRERPHVSYNSGNNEWYTPSEYIELAREVMGGIDLDPASCERANEVVQAKGYYTAETDGLAQDWFGNVWLNPPYSTELIAKFSEKLVKELPQIEAAIVLVNNATETEWFCKLVGMARAVCFPNGRVKFYRPDGTTGSPLQGQAILYYGDSPERFIETFRSKGWCALPQ